MVTDTCTSIFECQTFFVSLLHGIDYVYKMNYLREALSVMLLVMNTAVFPGSASM